MSSKGHIIFSTIIECYDETNEVQSDILGKFKGFNIYLIVEPSQFSFEIKDSFMKLKTNHRIIKELTIDMRDILEFTVDDDGLLLGVEGGSKTAELLSSYRGMED
jgi:hypothetical protein